MTGALLSVNPTGVAGERGPSVSFERSATPQHSPYLGSSDASSGEAHRMVSNARMLRRKQGDRTGFVSCHISATVPCTGKPLLVVEAGSVLLVNLGGSNTRAVWHIIRVRNTHQIKPQL